MKIGINLADGKNLTNWREWVTAFPDCSPNGTRFPDLKHEIKKRNENLHTYYMWVLALFYQQLNLQAV